MQSSSAFNRIKALYNEVMLSSSSTRDTRTTLCLREADQIYLYPQTHAGMMLMYGIRPVGYNVAIKTHPPTIRQLLSHSGDNAKMALLEDSSVIPIVDTAACLYQAKTHSAAILRDEEALVVWSMGTSETIGAQLREWESRIVRSVSHYERHKREQHQVSMPPSMFSPGFSDWMPKSFCGSQAPSPSANFPHEGYYQDVVPPPLVLASDLPSLLELESLHSIDEKEQRQTSSFSLMPPPNAFDYTSFLPYSPLSSPSLSPSSSSSLSPYSSQAANSSLEPSPFLTGTICLADISPAPQSFDDTSLPDDEVPSPVEATDLSLSTEDAPLPVSLRKIKGLPSRSASASPSPLSPIHLPAAPASPKAPRELSASPKLRSSLRSAATTATPLFSSLSLQNSPPLGTKRKSPSPSPGLSSRSPKSRMASASTSASPAPSSSKVTLSEYSLHDEDADAESDLSDLDGDSNEDEDEDGSDEDFEEPPPLKKTKMVSPKAPATKARPGRRRSGKAAAAGRKHKFMCETCHGKFTRDADRARHQQSACKGAQRNHRCHVCTAAFTRGDALMRHVKNLHPRKAEDSNSDSESD